LDKAVEIYFEDNEMPILAEIKKENRASIKSFERAGFIYQQTEVVDEVERIQYQLKK